MPSERRALSPDVIKAFLEQQAQELSVRERELEQNQQEAQHNFAYANRALDAQAKDRSEGRDARIAMQKNRHWLVFGLAILLAALIVMGFAFGKDEATLELAKALLFVSIGAFGGYGVARSGRHTNGADDQ